ncbi:hypothetical protein [Pseudarthrobacter chlorophenolicus]|uniref:hypothetical protein n=1 Tax=Pseudarthrobacter chlorophenolicus TaxID=85085 RepID=UPI000AF75D83|nr:hypothetical protein [Pseudarthrobacter chlorophenolicus]
MGEVLTAARRHQSGLAARGDLLWLQILGVEFVVRWGEGVNREQRQGMATAWSRCTSSVALEATPLPAAPATVQPVSACVAFQTPMQGVEEFELGASSFEELAENLTSRLTVAAILANAGKLTMLHACAVADLTTGAVVALVAKSGTGKTTAASVLGKTYGYVTDETVAIRPDGSVVPYPKPLSVKQGAGAPKRQVGPADLELLKAPPGLQLSSMVLLDRVVAAEPVTPVLRRVPLADAVMALIPDSSSQGKIDQPLQSLCRLIGSIGGVWQVTYSEATDLPEALAPLFGKQLHTEQEWEPRASLAATAGELPANFVRRAGHKDAVAIGDQLLVMLDSGIVQLAGIGPAIWEAAVEPLTPPRLTEAVAKVHGTPEGYSDAVVRAMNRLISEGVLKQGT